MKWPQCLSLLMLSNEAGEPPKNFLLRCNGEYAGTRDLQVFFMEVYGKNWWMDVIRAAKHEIEALIVSERDEEFQKLYYSMNLRQPQVKKLVQEYLYVAAAYFQDPALPSYQEYRSRAVAPNPQNAKGYEKKYMRPARGNHLKLA